MLVKPFSRSDILEIAGGKIWNIVIKISFYILTYLHTYPTTHRNRKVNQNLLRIWGWNGLLNSELIFLVKIIHMKRPTKIKLLVYYFCFCNAVFSEYYLYYGEGKFTKLKHSNSVSCFLTFQEVVDLNNHFQHFRLQAGKSSTYSGRYELIYRIFHFERIWNPL